MEILSKEIQKKLEEISGSGDVLGIIDLAVKSFWDGDYGIKGVIRKKCWQLILNKTNINYDSYSEPLPYITVTEIMQYTLNEFRDYINNLGDSFTKEEINYLELIYSILYLLCGDKEYSNYLSILKEKRYLFLSKNFELIYFYVFYIPDTQEYIIYNKGNIKLFEGKDDVSTISDEEIIEEISKIKEI